MGTVHRLPSPAEITLGEAVEVYLTMLARTQSAHTRRAYASTLRALTDHFGGDAGMGLNPAAVADWFTGQWGDASPATWNRARAALKGAAACWAEQGWDSADPAAQIRRRRVAPDRDRALSRADVDALLTREDIGLRERTLWRMLYETAARAHEVLSLNVEDLDQPSRSARVRRKGGAMDVIVWQTGTARLLPRLLKGRRGGPVFVTERKARVQLPPGDLDEHGRARLSYRQAEGVFKAATGGATLHQLRHSALTHAAEDGVSTPMLKARSGHTSVRSLAKYARVSAEALRRHQAETDPARRR